MSADALARAYTFEVPVKTASTSNLREHPMARYRRTDAQKAATRRRCPEWTAGPLLVVRLTRVSPRKLDDDNVRGALKSVRDALASWLRVDDASPLVRWEYLQERCNAQLVRVEVWAQPGVDAGAPAPAPPAPRAGGVQRRASPRSLQDLATPASYPSAPRSTP